MIVLIDTNTAVTANRKSPQASPECILECTRRLKKLTDEDQLVVDDHWRIIGEYQKNLRSEGQPGIGDAFLKWVLNNLRTGRVEYTTITPLGEDQYSFKEFPADPRLKDFDPADRKFVAVAKAHPEHPPIINAVDTDWWYFRAALEENDVSVEFLCPNDMPD